MFPKGLIVRTADISEQEFSIVEVPELYGDDIELSDLKVGSAMNYNILLAERLLIMSIRHQVNYAAHGTIMRAEVRLTYKIENLDEFILTKQPDSQLATVETGFLLAFTQVSLSAARGFIAARTMPYALNRFPMPFVDATQITIEAIERQQKEG
ncbi:MAG: hypothetical protein AAGN35_07465 [Bacteroidota bacterium]